MVSCTPTNFPTRLDPKTNKDSTINLTFASSDIDHLIDTSLGPSTWDSDHNPIPLYINLKYDLMYHLPSTWKFDLSKWSSWNKSIEDKLVDSNFSRISDPSLAYLTWFESVMSASRIFFKFASRNNQVKELCRPWWSAKIKKTVALARRAKLRCLVSPCVANKIDFNRFDALKKKLISLAKTKSWKSFISDLDSGKSRDIWRFTKKIISSAPSNLGHRAGPNTQPNV